MVDELDEDEGVAAVDAAATSPFVAPLVPFF